MKIEVKEKAINKIMDVYNKSKNISNVVTNNDDMNFILKATMCDGIELENTIKKGGDIAIFKATCNPKSKNTDEIDVLCSDVIEGTNIRYTNYDEKVVFQLVYPFADMEDKDAINGLCENCLSLINQIADKIDGFECSSLLEEDLDDEETKVDTDNANNTIDQDTDLEDDLDDDFDVFDSIVDNVENSVAKPQDKSNNNTSENTQDNNTVLDKEMDIFESAIKYDDNKDYEVVKSNNAIDEMDDELSRMLNEIESEEADIDKVDVSNKVENSTSDIANVSDDNTTININNTDISSMSSNENNIEIADNENKDIAQIKEKYKDYPSVLDAMKDMYADLNRVMSNKKKVIDDRNKLLDTYAKKLNDREKSIADVSAQNEKDFEKRKIALEEEFKSKTKELEKSYYLKELELDKQRTSLENDRKNYEVDKEKLNHEWNKLDLEKETLIERSNELDERTKLVGVVGDNVVPENDDLKIQIEMLENEKVANLATIDKLKELSSKKDTVINMFKSKQTEWVSEKDIANKEINELKNQIIQLTKEIDEAKQNATSVVGDSKIDSKDFEVLNKRLEEMQTTMEEMTNINTSLKKEIADIGVKRDQYEQMYLAEKKEKEDLITQQEEAELNSTNTKKALAQNVAQIQSTLRNVGVELQVVPGNGDMILNGIKEGYVICVNAKAGVLYVEKEVKKPSKYIKTLEKWNMEDIRVAYLTTENKVICKYTYDVIDKAFLETIDKMRDIV